MTPFKRFNLEYAVPVYNFEFVKTSDFDLVFTIDDDLLLEVVMLFKIRNETIKFASNLKAEKSVQQNLRIKIDILAKD